MLGNYLIDEINLPENCNFSHSKPCKRHFDLRRNLILLFCL